MIQNGLLGSKLEASNHLALFQYGTKYLYYALSIQNPLEIEWMSDTPRDLHVRLYPVQPDPECPAERVSQQTLCKQTKSHLEIKYDIMHANRCSTMSDQAAKKQQ